MVIIMIVITYYSGTGF